MAERVSSEELAKWLAVHREREEGRDCDCWDCEKSRDLLDARAALRMIAEFPIPEQDDFLSANMRIIARSAVEVK